MLARARYTAAPLAPARHQAAVPPLLRAPAVREDRALVESSDLCRVAGRAHRRAASAAGAKQVWICPGYTFEHIGAGGDLAHLQSKIAGRRLIVCAGEIRAL